MLLTETRTRERVFKLPGFRSPATLRHHSCFSRIYPTYFMTKHPRFPRLLATAALGLLAAGVAHAQPQSQAAGFLRCTVAAAANSATPTDTLLSFPLHDAPVFSGSVGTVDSPTALTVTAASWTDGQFTAAPHVAHFVNGDNTGRWFLITANSLSQLTLDPRDFTLTGLVNAGDELEIFPAHTLGGLFGTSSVALQSGHNLKTADNVSVWDGAKFIKYYFNGLNWTDDTNANRNDVVIPPDSGVIVLRRATRPVTLMFSGMVPDTSERSDVDGPGSLLLANRFPLPTTLGALGLADLPNWRSRAKARKADEVMFWKKGQWDAYFFDGKNWHASDKPGKNADTKVIPAGSAVFVVRKSKASGTTATLAQDPAYVGN